MTTKITYATFRSVESTRTPEKSNPLAVFPLMALVNHGCIVGKTRRHICAIFQDCCAIFFASGHASASSFAFCWENLLNIRWVNRHPVSLWVVKHAFQWYFALFWGKFRIIASVLSLCVSFLSVLFFTLFPTMRGHHHYHHFNHQDYHHQSHWGKKQWRRLQQQSHQLVQLNHNLEYHRYHCLALKPPQNSDSGSNNNSTNDNSGTHCCPWRDPRWTMWTMIYRK